MVGGVGSTAPCALDMFLLILHPSSSFAFCPYGAQHVPYIQCSSSVMQKSDRSQLGAQAAAACNRSAPQSGGVLRWQLAARSLPLPGPASSDHLLTPDMQPPLGNLSSALPAAAAPGGQCHSILPPQLHALSKVQALLQGARDGYGLQDAVTQNMHLGGEGGHVAEGYSESMHVDRGSMQNRGEHQKGEAKNQ